MTARTWGWIGGMTEFDSWGSVDVDLLNRRRVLGIEAVTLLDEDCLCVHQNHDLPGSDEPVRELERAKSGLPVYRRPQDAIRDNLWPRSRGGFETLSALP